MPDLDGRVRYQEIERRWPEQAERVIFVTGDVRRIVAELATECERGSP